MINVIPGGKNLVRQDLPIFPLTVSFRGRAGIHYLGPVGLVSAPAQAARLDNAGERHLRGLKLAISGGLPAGQSITVAPCISTDNGLTWPAQTALQGALSSSSTRDSVFLDDGSLIHMMDDAQAIYRITLARTMRRRLALTVTLYLL